MTTKVSSANARTSAALKSCTTCTHALALAYAHPGVWYSCAECGSDWIADGTHRAPSRLPVITAEGADPVRRTEGDLALLRRWLPRLTCRPAALERSSPDTAGRVEREDRDTSAWHRAVAIHRRYESMRRGDGRRLYAILEWCYLRDRAGAPGERLYVEIGRRFPDAVHAQRWRSPSQVPTEAGFERLGRRWHDDACRAYCAADGVLGPSVREQTVSLTSCVRCGRIREIERCRACEVLTRVRE